MAVTLGHGHLGESDHVTGARLKLAPGLQLVAQAFGLLAEPLRPLGILPDVRVF
jgi:hypothetical protein